MSDSVPERTRFLAQCLQCRNEVRREQNGCGRNVQQLIVVIAQACVFEMPQPVLNQSANFTRIVHPAEPGRVQTLCRMLSLRGRSAAGRVHAQVGNAQRPLDGPL